MYQEHEYHPSARAHRWGWRSSAVALAVCAAITGPWATALAEPKFAKGRILVQPKPGMSGEAFEQIIERAGGRTTGRLDKIRVHIVEVPENAEEAVARAIARNPNVEFAEPDVIVAPEALTANDPKFSSAWHLPKIGAPDAWVSTLGDGATVAVLDTGVYGNHPDLVNKLLPGWNAASQNSDTSDINGHGTQIAGIVGAESNNALGVTSVAWNTWLLPVRISNRTDGLASASDISRGIIWAADNGADVASISYPASGVGAVASAAQYMRSQGGLVVVAAGNGGTDPGYSDSADTIAVSATTSSDDKASWSNYGDFIDVAAPGVGIWTTTRSGGYSSPSGTSTSTPVIAAVVALIRAANPNLSPADIESILESSADDIGAAGKDELFGHGRVNAARAVVLALNTSAGDSQPPTARVDSPSAGATVGGNVSVAVTANDNQAVDRVELFDGGSRVGTDYSAPFSFAWDTSSRADGQAVLTAYAYDGSGNQGVSSPVSVTVDNEPNPVDGGPPSVSILSPAEGATVRRTVTITAEAWDDTGIAMLTVKVDGQTLCAANQTTISCSWNTRKASSGAHTITAVAKDLAGKTVSETIGVAIGSSGGPGGGKGKWKK